MSYRVGIRVIESPWKVFFVNNISVYSWFVSGNLSPDQVLSISSVNLSPHELIKMTEVFKKNSLKN